MLWRDFYVTMCQRTRYNLMALSSKLFYKSVSLYGETECTVLEFLSRITVLTKKTPFSYLIRTFLQAGKHVCVEYPMTMNYMAAVELWDFAQEKGDINV